MRIKWMAWAALLLAASCVSRNKDAEQNREEGQASRLDVVASPALLREAAGENAKVIQRLPKGATLFALPEVSRFTTPLQLQGKTYDEPWLLVKTSEGAKGWVYAADVQLHSSEESARRLFNLENRLQSLAGAPFRARLSQYREEYQAIADADDFAVVFRNGRTQCDSLINVLAARVTPANSAPADLFWLGEVCPGYAPQLVAEGTAYHLFEDYRQWLQKARQTHESDDDELIQLFISAFPEDSIAYFFPVWTIQTTDYSGHSLLGRGRHLFLLRQVQTLLARSKRFEPEITALKADLLNDMTQAGVTYWESREKIIAELDAILAADFSFWSPADKIALQTRRNQLERPEDYGIQVNQQAGF